jgi:hypothetical protein
MTACCRRLTQPATRSTTKASGGGSESMAQSVPPEVGGRQATLDSEIRRYQAAGLPKGKPPVAASNPPISARFALGQVFAQDGITGGDDFGVALRTSRCCGGAGHPK